MTKERKRNYMRFLIIFSLTIWIRFMALDRTTSPIRGIFGHSAYRIKRNDECKKQLSESRH